MAGDLVAVTGATGALGGRVARRLADRGVAQRLSCATPTGPRRCRAPRWPRPGYADGAAMRLALAGVDTLLLVSATEASGREAVHRAAVDAAIDAGVRRIVYTSFFGAGPAATFTFARHHWDTEAVPALARRPRTRSCATTCTSTCCRPSSGPTWSCADRPATVGWPGSPATTSPTPRRRCSPTDGRRHEGRTYSLTGAQAFTLHDATRELSVATGRTVTYYAETVDEAYASRAHYGAPDWEVEGWVSTYTAIAAGEMAAVTDHVQASGRTSTDELRRLPRRQPARARTTNGCTAAR